MDILNENFQKSIKTYCLALFGFFFASGLILYILDINRKAAALFFLMGVLFIAIPTSILNYLKFKKYESLEDEFPEFMKNFAEIKKTGVTFPQAFEQMAHTDLGPLTPYIERTSAQISWGIPFPKAIKNLSNSIMESKVIKQSFIIISEAFQMGGNVSEVMSNLASNISSIKEINMRRTAAISQQVMMMYFIFFIFLATIIGVYKLLIPMLSIQVNVSSPGSLMTGGGVDVGKKQMPNFCSVQPIAPILCAFGSAIGFEKDIKIKKPKPGTEDDEEEQININEDQLKRSYLYFKSLFFLMCLVQATCTGLIAGMLKTGKAVAAVSHIGIMGISTLVVFILFV